MENENFRIVQATEIHRYFVVNVIKERWGVSEEEADSEFTRWINNDQNSICYIGLFKVNAQSGKEELMATAVFDTVREESGLNISPYNTLLFVQPKYRGNGFGKLLSEIRYEWALKNGYKIIYLDTLDSGKYHEKVGWKFLKHIEHNDKKFTIMHRILDNKLSFESTRVLSDFAPILKPLAQDFTAIFYQTMLVWCKIIPSDNAQGDRLWEVWLVKIGNKPIGVCGLYTLKGATDTKELWLGWLGIIPELRNLGLGKQIMKHLYDSGKNFGCTKIFSYVDKDGLPLPFYKREGFEVIGTVSEYCAEQGLKNIDGDDFEDGDDFVISKQLVL